MSEEQTFESFGLSEPVRRAVAEVGYASPTLVQQATFQTIAEGKDVIVQSRTGSGKTAAFALPLIDRVIKPARHVQVMVLCPTRELALQVAGEFERLGKFADVGVAPIYGGAGMQQQIDMLKAGAKVVVGTPGRMLDHLRRKTLDVSGLKAIVLDEGDEMLSMGFAEELNAILGMLPKGRQALIFSATMPDAMSRMAARHQREPVTIALSSDHVAPDGIVHHAYFSASGGSVPDLLKVLEIEKPKAALVFCNTKAETEMVARGLQNAGYRAEYLNGDLAQNDRERVMGLLREERVDFLVATDVAARGIDVPHLSHVIHCGFPESPEAYVHRSGRTGRAGRTGTAISLIGPHDIGNLYLLRLTYGIRPIERTLPSAAQNRTRIEAARVDSLVAAAGKVSDDALVLAKRLLTHDDAERAVAWLVERFVMGVREDDVMPAVPPPVASAAVAADAPPAEPRANGRLPRERAPRRERTEVEPERKIEVRHADPKASDETPGEEIGMESLELAVGRREGVRAGEVARLLRDVGGLAKSDVGRIHVRDRVTLVSVRAERLDEVLGLLAEIKYNEAPISPRRGDAAESPPAPAAPEAVAAD
jgi:ATP-dependent RNA helicase DeaD